MNTIVVPHGMRLRVIARDEYSVTYVLDKVKENARRVFAELERVTEAARAAAESEALR